MRIRQILITVLILSILMPEIATATSMTLTGQQARTAVVRGAKLKYAWSFAKRHPYLTAVGGALVASAAVRGAQTLAREDQIEDGGQTRLCLDSSGHLMDMTECDPRLNTNAIAGQSLVGDQGYSTAPNGHIIALSNSEILTKNMQAARTAAGDRVDEDKERGCEAHHIVMATSQDGFVVKSRAILASCRIDINSSLNGVYLPRDGGILKAERPLLCRHAVSHSTIHTGVYKKRVYDILELAKGTNYVNDALVPDCESVKGALWNMKLSLESGVMP